MEKIHIYFMPGLAAGPAIFENLQLDANQFELHYLSWLKPLAIEESISNYAMRLSDEIKHKNAVLVGVSFGGIMVQEMAKYIDTKKVIIISSVKTKYELPKRLKVANFTKAYKFFPTSLVSNFEYFMQFFVGKALQKKAKIYQKYLAERDKLYLDWSIKNVIEWKQEKSDENLIHIHGTKDDVFPIKHIQNCIEIENGTHIMILTKAKEISKIINSTLLDK